MRKLVSVLMLLAFVGIGLEACKRKEDNGAPAGEGKPTSVKPGLPRSAPGSAEEQGRNQLLPGAASTDSGLSTPNGGTTPVTSGSSRSLWEPLRRSEAAQTVTHGRLRVALVANYAVNVVIALHPSFPKREALSEENWEANAPAGVRIWMYSMTPKEPADVWLGELAIVGPMDAAAFENVSIRLKGDERWVPLSEVALQRD